MAAFPDRFALAAAVVLPGYFALVAPTSDRFFENLGVVVLFAAVAGVFLDSIRWFLFDLPLGVGRTRMVLDEEGRRRRSALYRPYQLFGNLMVALPLLLLEKLLEGEEPWHWIYLLALFLLVEIALFVRLLHLRSVLAGGELPHSRPNGGGG